VHPHAYATSTRRLVAFDAEDVDTEGRRERRQCRVSTAEGGCDDAGNALFG